jgi:hypothetical protein
MILVAAGLKEEKEIPPMLPQSRNIVTQNEKTLSRHTASNKYNQMSGHDEFHGALFGICNPLLDISVNAEQELFDKCVFFQASSAFSKHVSNPSFICKISFLPFPRGSHSRIIALLLSLTQSLIASLPFFACFRFGAQPGNASLAKDDQVHLFVSVLLVHITSLASDDF